MMDPDPYCNFQVFAMVPGASEAPVKMSTLYHAYGHVTIIKGQESMGRLILLATF